MQSFAVDVLDEIIQLFFEQLRRRRQSQAGRQMSDRVCGWRESEVHAGWVLDIVPGNCVEHDSGVESGAGHRSDMIVGPAEWDDSGGANQAVSRFQAGDSAKRCGKADGAG